VGAVAPHRGACWMSRWLVTGAGGMLGRDLILALRSRGKQVTGLDRSGLDVRDRGWVAAVIAGHQPDVVVNCAAWTNVDDAQASEADAFAVNATGPANLAAACAGVGAVLIQVSTDYVFSGTAARPYAEDDPTEPRNAYGRTKLGGEVAVLSTLPQTGYVVRTAWLYGAHGPNFVRTMIRLERERDTVDVVDDQRGQPTWTADVAQRLMDLPGCGAPAGVYHATSSGETTWHGLACEVFARLGADLGRVRPVSSAVVARSAPRPAYSVLGHGCWNGTGMEPIRHWRLALDQAFPALR
jgi:dTDP-4-dehydrorhamnose reductase